MASLKASINLVAVVTAITMTFVIKGEASGQQDSTKANEVHAIVEPFLANSDGSFLSHNVRYTLASEGRRKRDVLEHPRNTMDKIYLNFNLNNKETFLNLTSNKKLTSPGFLVEKISFDGDFDNIESTMDAGDAVSSIATTELLPCHYQGVVTGEPDSRVALSTCHGLHGLIRIKGEEFFIEPLESNSETNKKHKITRRDVNMAREDHHKKDHPVHTNKPKRSSSDQEFCGVSDTNHKYTKSLRGRVLWELTRKRRSNSRELRKGRKRTRRSVSQERWIEALVVVDKEMVDHYSEKEDGYLETYVLTITNMVSDLFRDSSIGNSLHLTLVRLILLTGDEKGLHISKHAERTLESFCRWSKKMNPKDDKHPQHHDVAILLTRHDICSNNNKSCDTLGLAHVAGMCQWHRSCNVNQDTGLSLAYTVAHELGHNFAMHHDGQSNECTPNGRHPTVMSSTLTSNNKVMKWSPCSKNYITKFLDRNWGFCLSDRPTPNDNLTFSNELPGKIYNADHQCRLMFGESSRHCYGIDDVCNRLWCSYHGSCKSRLHSAAPGTPCGKDKLCYNGKCVSRNRRPHPVDGTWSAWSEWSKCSRTCGIGISSSLRVCNNPSPKHNGQFCLGERKRYKTCNKWKCREDSVSFRELQCSEFNHIKYKNKTYEWKPVDSHVYPCELHCFAETDTNPIADRLRSHVVDGTPCYKNKDDVCVDGICRRLSCDKNIGSNATEDKCGVCHGNGETCKDVDKTFSKRLGDEYVEIGILPRGARNILITESVRTSKNFLALRNPNNESDFYLNGNFMIQWDTQFKLADTWFTYKRINDTLDNIKAKGPITHSVMVMLLFVEVNKGVNISYTVPNNESIVMEEPEVIPEFYWTMEEWTSCSLTCGKGVQRSLAKCYEMNAGTVDEDFCSSKPRPDDKHKSCNDFPCPAEWWVGDWQDCSVSCGEKKGTKTRTVICIQSVEGKEQINVNESFCDQLNRPEKYEDCRQSPIIPCPFWKTSDWGGCSVTCGGGNANRAVQCGHYITTDVIDLDPDDMEAINQKMKEDDLLLNDVPSAESELEHERRFQVLLAAKSIIVEKDMDNLNVEFVEESLDRCDYSLKPKQWKPCNEINCHETTRFNMQTTKADRPTSDNLLNITSEYEFDITDSTLYEDETTGFPLPSDDDLEVDYPGQDEFDIEQPNADTDDIDGPLIKPEMDSINLQKHEAYFDLKEGINGTWDTGNWSECSTTCGVGAKVRSVKCSTGNATDCQHSFQPAPAQICEERPCTKWLYGEWSECSRNCGDGSRTKEGVCVDERSEEELRPYHCSHLDIFPTLTISCNLHRCMPWKTSRWTHCNATCGAGIQRRRTKCSRFGKCDPSLQPKTTKTCMMKKCVDWNPSDWDDCSVNCGGGVQKRVVNCVDRDTTAAVNSTLCNVNYMPSKMRKCNEFKCRVTDYDFASCKSDRLTPTFCNLLKKWKKCVQPSLAIQCCVTCKTYLNIRGKDKIS